MEKKKELQKSLKEEPRYVALAKPKNKWNVGEKMLELHGKFKHDRVLERMIKEEYKQN